MHNHTNEAKEVYKNSPVLHIEKMFNIWRNMVKRYLNMQSSTMKDNDETLRDLPVSFNRLKVQYNFLKGSYLVYSPK